MTRRIQRGLIWGLIGGVCFILLLIPGLIDLLVAPLVGLVAAPRRVLSLWQPTLHGLLLFGIAVVVLVMGTHSFLAWVFKARNRKLQADAKSTRPWRLPWTLCGFGMICCTLVAVVSTVLIAHQTYWLRHSSEPWFVNSSSQKLERIVMVNSLRALAEEKQWAAEPIRAALTQATTTRRDQALWEEYEPVLIGDNTGKLKAVLMVPREVSKQSYQQVLIMQPASGVSWQPLAKLPQLLASVGLTENNAADHLKPQPVGQ